MQTLFDVLPLKTGMPAEERLTVDLLRRKIITKQKSRREDCSLIVVASLVDKPNNL
ncbi:unnamed protein product, partial [Strongylus vulgaris]